MNWSETKIDNFSEKWNFFLPKDEFSQIKQRVLNLNLGKYFDLGENIHDLTKDILD